MPHEHVTNDIPSETIRTQTDVDDEDNTPTDTHVEEESDTRVGQRAKGKNPPRITRTGPYAHPSVNVMIDDVLEVTVNSNDDEVISDVRIPKTFKEAIISRYAHR